VAVVDMTAVVSAHLPTLPFRPRALAPISDVQGTGMSAAGFYSAAADVRTPNGSPPREAPV